VTREDPTEPLKDDEDPTEPLIGAGDPTEPLPSGGEDPTEALPEGGVAPTDRLRPGGEAPDGKPESGDEAPTEPRERWAPHQPGVKSGTGILVASVLASLALIVTYVFAGGLDFKPTPVADPCDSRVWSDPSGFEDTAQQLALSTLDGAACDLGVSREQLTRALASDRSIADFLADEGISQEQFDDAVKSGLARAVDEAENNGAIDPLVASGIRAAVRFLPVSELIPLIQDASRAIGGSSTLQDLLNGDFDLGDLLGGGSGLQDLLDSGLDALGGGSEEGSGGSQGGDSGGSGGGGSGGVLDGLIPDDVPGRLRDQLPPEIEKNLPEGIEDDLGKQLQKQLESLLGD
jgi:hypothetical protein